MTKIGYFHFSKPLLREEKFHFTLPAILAHRLYFHLFLCVFYIYKKNSGYTQGTLYQTRQDASIIFHTNIESAERQNGKFFVSIVPRIRYSKYRWTEFKKICQSGCNKKKKTAKSLILLISSFLTITEYIQFKNQKEIKQQKLLPLKGGPWKVLQQ